MTMTTETSTAMTRKEKCAAIRQQAKAAGWKADFWHGAHLSSNFKAFLDGVMVLDGEKSPLGGGETAQYDRKWHPALKPLTAAESQEIISWAKLGDHRRRRVDAVVPSAKTTDRVRALIAGYTGKLRRNSEHHLGYVSISEGKKKRLPFESKHGLVMAVGVWVSNRGNLIANDKWAVIKSDCWRTKGFVYRANRDYELKLMWNQDRIAQYQKWVLMCDIRVITRFGVGYDCDYYTDEDGKNHNPLTFAEGWVRDDEERQNQPLVKWQPFASKEGSGGWVNGEMKYRTCPELSKAGERFWVGFRAFSCGAAVSVEGASSAARLQTEEAAKQLCEAEEQAEREREAAL